MHPLYEDRWLKGVYALARFLDRTSDGRLDGKIELSQVPEKVLLEPVASVQTWLPVKELLYETSSSVAGLLFYDQAGGLESCGSGIVWRVEPDPVRGGWVNYLVTNHHVIAALRQITTNPTRGEAARPLVIQVRENYAEATFEVGGIPSTFSIDAVVLDQEEPDIAVFTVYTPERILEPATPLVDIEWDQLVGHRALIVGYASCLRGFATATLVARRDLEFLTPAAQLDGAMNPGHSGGATFHLGLHHLVGINFAKLSDADSIGLVIPVGVVAPLIDGAIEDDLATRRRLFENSRSSEEYLERLRSP